MNELEELQGRIREFVRERDWEQFHTPKNLAMALAGEAGELLELFQWLTPEESAAVMDDPQRARAVADQHRTLDQDATRKTLLENLNHRHWQEVGERCLSCGNCFECDGCYGACPEGAVIKLGPGRRYRFDYALCTGCAVCFEQCPCHAIEMIDEQQVGGVSAI